MAKPGIGLAGQRKRGRERGQSARDELPNPSVQSLGHSVGRSTTRVWIFFFSDWISALNFCPGRPDGKRHANATAEEEEEDR